MKGLGVKDLYFDENRLQIVDGGNTSKLDPKVAKLLLYFLANPNRVITREELLTNIWGNQHISDDAVNRSISVLRKSLGKVGRKQLVTVHKVGYRFELIQNNNSSIEPLNAPTVQPTWKLLTLVLSITTILIAFFMSRQPPAATSNAPRVAVLPFSLNDGQHHFLTDILSGEIISVLSQSQTLLTISERSSLRFKGTQLPLHEIAKQLQADVLIDGKVHQLKGRTRVSIDIVDVPSAVNLWSKQFFFKTSEFSEQKLNQLSQSVYRFLHERYKGEQGGITSGNSTESSAAYRAFLEGKQALRERTTTSLTIAENKFKQAIALDPQYIKAKAYLYFTYWHSVELLGTSYKELYPQLAPLYREFAASNSALPEVFAAKGLYMVFEGDFALAERLTRQAVEMSPSNILYVEQLALVQSYRGNIDAAIALLEQAIELNPLVLSSRAKLIKLYRDSGRFDRAFSLLEQMLEIERYSNLTASAFISLEYSINKNLEGTLNYLENVDVTRHAKLLNQTAQLHLLASDIDKSLDLIAIRAGQAPLDFNLHLTLSTFYRHSLDNHWTQEQHHTLEQVWRLLPPEYVDLIKLIAEVTGGDYQAYLSKVVHNPLIISEMDNFYFRRSLGSTGLYIFGLLSLNSGDVDNAKLVFKGSQWLYDYCVAEQFLYMCPSVLYLSQKHSMLDIITIAIKSRPKGLEYEYMIGREKHLTTDPFFIMLHDNLLYRQFSRDMKGQFAEMTNNIK